MRQYLWQRVEQLKLNTTHVSRATFAEICYDSIFHHFYACYVSPLLGVSLFTLNFFNFCLLFVLRPIITLCSQKQTKPSEILCNKKSKRTTKQKRVRDCWVKKRGERFTKQTRKRIQYTTRSIGNHSIEHYPLQNGQFLINLVSSPKWFTNFIVFDCLSNI